jgi:hypothetical protein
MCAERGSKVQVSSHKLLFTDSQKWDWSYLREALAHNRLRYTIARGAVKRPPISVEATDPAVSAGADGKDGGVQNGFGQTHVILIKG